MLRKTLSILVLLLTLNLLTYSQNNKSTPPSEASQFDFWIGTWDLEWADNEGNIQTGTNHIREILNGFVVEENFSGLPSMQFEGKSYSVYNSSTKKWQQTWVDNSGGYLDFVGGMEGNKMILFRSFVKNDKEIFQRMVFYNISENSLDWNWESSTDGGKTFNLLWKIHYTRKE